MLSHLNKRLGVFTRCICVQHLSLFVVKSNLKCIFFVDYGEACHLQCEQGGVRQLPDNQQQPKNYCLLYGTYREKVIIVIMVIIMTIITALLLFRVFTIRFRSFSPMPNALEFYPGKSYYFISTSSQYDYKSRNGGYCVSNNMKVNYF